MLTLKCTCRINIRLQYQFFIIIYVLGVYLQYISTFGSVMCQIGQFMISLLDGYMMQLVLFLLSYRFEVRSVYLLLAVFIYPVVMNTLVVILIDSYLVQFPLRLIATVLLHNPTIISVL